MKSNNPHSTATSSSKEYPPPSQYLGRATNDDYPKQFLEFSHSSESRPLTEITTEDPAAVNPLEITENCRVKAEFDPQRP
ncbi:hypothetical protein AYI69_g3230, partial [Smittium culicis]